MRALKICALLLLFASGPAAAGTRSCTTAMVTLNVCRSTTDVAYCLAIGTADPDSAGPLQPPSVLVSNAFADLGNWQTPSACTTDMVSAGICAAGQVGTLVPITKAQFVDLQIRAFVMGTVRRYLRQQQTAAAQAAADAASDPDIGN